MKRFTLILSLLVAMVTTAMAGNLVGSTTDNPVYFKLKNANGDYIKANAVNGNEETAGKFAFYAVDGVENAYYIYSVDEEKWFNYTLAGSYSNAKGFISLSEEKGNYFNFTECSKDGKNGYQIAPYNTTGVAAKYLNYFEGVDDESTIGLWQGDGNGDAGSCWLLEEYADVIYVSNPADITSTALYTIVPKASSRGVIFANSESTHLTTTALANVNIQDANQQFMFITKDGKTYLYSVGANKFVNDEGKYLNLTAAPKDYVVVEQADVEGYMLIKMNASDLINVSTGWAHGALADYNTVDDGNRLRIRYVKEASEELLAAIEEINAKVTYNFVYEGATLATQIEIVSKGSAYPAFNVPNAPLGIVPAESVPSGIVTEDAVFEIELTVNNDLIPFEYVAEGTPSVWYYARMHGNSNVTSYIEDNGSETIEWSDKNIEASEIDSHLWGFVGDAFNGFKMVNKGTGDAIASTGDGNATMAEVASATAFHAMASDNGTQGAFCLKYKDNDNYINAQDGIIKHWNDNDNGSTFFLTEYSDEEVATVEVSAANYATLFLGEPVYIPAGVEAYVVSGAAEGWAHMEQVTGILPANTGVILKNTGNYTFTLAPARISGVGTNLLAGTLTDTEIAKEEGNSYYILANGEAGIGFYNPVLGEDETKFNNAANKAYLVVPAEQAEGIACYSFRFGEGTTGIEEITDNREQSTVIYDLTGRRVEAITAPGIYVVNGKKVLVK